MTAAELALNVHLFGVTYLGEALDVGVGWRRFACTIAFSGIAEVIQGQTLLIHDDDPQEIVFETTPST